VTITDPKMYAKPWVPLNKFRLGMNSPDFDIREMICAVSQQTLSDILVVDRSTMVAFVDELEAKGYVRRGRNPTDRRAYAIELTAPGANAQREAAGLLEDCERHYLDPLTAAERRTLLVLLGRLVARDLRET